MLLLYIIRWCVIYPISLCPIHLVHGQNCLLGLNNGEREEPPFRDGNLRPLPTSRTVQAIVKTYQFFCNCVNITAWETYVQPGGEDHSEDRAYDITFQVWRPSPSVNETGCYSLVGQNVFRRFSFPEGGFVRLMPSANTFITAQVGDVVGYLTTSRSGSNDGIQLENSRDYSSNEIWYQDIEATNAISSGECPLPVGTETGRILTSFTNAAPMLRLDTSEL